MKNAFYIITIHNKQDLIGKVLEGIINSTSNTKFNVHILCVLDGCTDESEKIIDTYVKSHGEKYKFHKIYEDDVHELLSLNSAFKYIEGLDSSPEDLLFLLQDDVILTEDNLNELIENLYFNIPKLGYVSFRCGMKTNLNPETGLLMEHTHTESTYGHWKQLGETFFRELQDKQFAFYEIVIKSPTCIKKSILDEVGYFDEYLAPFGHDDLDLSIRLNKLGYQNAVFGASFESKVDWGGTREEKNKEKDYHKKYSDIIQRNKIYLTNKHIDYYEANQKSFLDLLEKINSRK